MKKLIRKILAPLVKQMVQGEMRVITEVSERVIIDFAKSLEVELTTRDGQDRKYKVVPDNLQ